MRRLLYLSLGFASVALGAVGIVLPLLPTVPFMLLAAFFFARSSPRLEAWIVGHRRFGPHIRAWRERGAISRAGKRAALATFPVQRRARPRPPPLALAARARGGRSDRRKLDRDETGRVTCFPTGARPALPVFVPGSR
jgi:uncharacterized membrane protein YbaN (DUF454 family)